MKNGNDKGDPKGHDDPNRKKDVPYVGGGKAIQIGTTVPLKNDKPEGF